MTFNLMSKKYSNALINQASKSVEVVVFPTFISFSKFMNLLCIDTKWLLIRLSRDPAVWSSFVNEGTIHIVNRAVTRGNVGRGNEKSGLGRVDFSSVCDEMGGR